MCKTSGFSLVACIVSKKNFSVVWCLAPLVQFAWDYGQDGRKTNTTNADSCKCYREKNAEEYKINDALRTKRARLLLKLNKGAC